ncbi:MAG: ABC transporter substrate-binding protein [Bifidobacteriaceae bacterium]|jgi:D-methionine transport system substrate-binding protein|nr:ABC transporter substrate-binding protein [Bifidobacteriaceae bacterium]
MKNERVVDLRSVFLKAMAIAFAALLVFTLASCSSNGGGDAKGSQSNPVIIGVVGASDAQYVELKKAAEAEGIYIDYKDFSDYPSVNPALTEGSLDLNQFQHIQYLAKYNVDANADLVPYAATAVFPISLYGNLTENVKQLSDVKDGAQIAIPNDNTNQARALFVLNNAGLIKFKSEGLLLPTPADIDEANSKVKVLPVDASQTAIQVADPKVAAAVVNNDYVKNLPDGVADNVLTTESADSDGAKPYINIFVSRTEDQDNETYLKIADIFNTNADVQAALAEESGGADKLKVIGNLYSKADLQEILAQQIELYKETL